MEFGPFLLRNSSIISLAELYEGVYYSRDPEASRVALEAFLEDVSILGIDEEISKRFKDWENQEDAIYDQWREHYHHI